MDLMFKIPSNRPYVIAVDFDGTIVENKFPEIGKLNSSLFLEMHKLKRQYKEKLIFCLWTARTNNSERKYLDEAINFCKDMELPIDFFNDIPHNEFTEEEHTFTTPYRKVYADEYWDDRARTVQY